MPTIILLGDSVLDNFYWLDDPTKDATYTLRSLGHNVYNYAVDESIITSVIDGIVPASTYRSTRSYPYPVDDDGVVRPIPLLLRTSHDMSVLSVGGNDLRAKIANIIYGIDYFINCVFTPLFYEQYDYVVNCMKARGKVVLVAIYSPYLGPGSIYASLKHYHTELFKRIRAFYYIMGRRHNVPVLDLSRTFDPMVRSHYGSTVIEPSNSSSFCLAHCINHIYKYYDGYHVYYAPDCGPEIYTETPNI